MEPEKIPCRLLFRCYKDTPCSHPFSMSTPGCETTSQKPTFTPPKMEETTTKNRQPFFETCRWWYIFWKSHPHGFETHICFFCWTWQKICQLLSFLSRGRGKRLHRRYGQSCRQFVTFSCSTTRWSPWCSIKRGHKHVHIKGCWDPRSPKNMLINTPKCRRKPIQT